ncbi:hypothetical protein EJB05_00573, partial [Eragrostis curvula]
RPSYRVVVFSLTWHSRFSPRALLPDVRSAGHRQAGSSGARAAVTETRLPHHPQIPPCLHALPYALISPLLSSDGGALHRLPRSTNPTAEPGLQPRTKMSAVFSAERLAEMLARIDPSQATLSHWCVFNSRYCQQVVETWESEFRKAPCDRRKSLLYLANDIMQNTRKDSDGGYIAEFMRVIPDVLNEVDTPCGVEKRDHDSLGEPTMSDEQSKLPE